MMTVALNVKSSTLLDFQISPSFGTFCAQYKVSKTKTDDIQNNLDCKISNTTKRLPSGLPTSGLLPGGQYTRGSGLPTPIIMLFMHCLRMIWPLSECRGPRL